MSNVSFKEILNQYNDAVSAVRDLENALSKLVGKEDWEDNVMSDKRKSIQVLYTELKSQRNVREDLEGNIYSLEQGNVSNGTQTATTTTTTTTSPQTQPTTAGNTATSGSSNP